MIVEYGHDHRRPRHGCDRNRANCRDGRAVWRTFSASHLYARASSSTACAGRIPRRTLPADLPRRKPGMKAIGTGHAFGVLWKDLEVVRHGGPPQLQFHNAAARHFARLGASRALSTITHTDSLALHTSFWWAKRRRLILAAEPALTLSAAAIRPRKGRSAPAAASSRPLRLTRRAIRDQRTTLDPCVADVGALRPFRSLAEPSTQRSSRRGRQNHHERQGQPTRQAGRRRASLSPMARSTD